MDKKESYSKLLKDPRWQKKRLEILQRDDFTCQYCGAKNKLLNIHHIFYEKGKMPWEYKDKKMITLCEDCHHYEHESEQNVKSLIDNFRENGILMPEIESLICLSMVRILGLGDFDFINSLMDDMPERVMKLKWHELKIYDLCKKLSEWHKKVDAI